MTDLDKLRRVRTMLAAAIEMPTGFNAEVTDQGLDLNAETAEIAFEFPGGARYELTLREMT